MQVGAQRRTLFLPFLAFAVDGAFAARLVVEPADVVVEIPAAAIEPVEREPGVGVADAIVEEPPVGASYSGSSTLSRVKENSLSYTSTLVSSYNVRPAEAQPARCSLATSRRRDRSGRNKVHNVFNGVHGRPGEDARPLGHAAGPS